MIKQIGLEYGVFFILLKLNVQLLQNLKIYQIRRIIKNQKTETYKFSKKIKNTKLNTEPEKYRKREKRTEFKFEGQSSQ